MSIKIDLLPRYVALQRRFRSLTYISGSLVLGTVAVLGLIYYKGQLDLAQRREDLANATEVAERTGKAKEATAAAKSAADPLDAFVQFAVDASKTGSERAALLDLVARYLAPGSVISQIDMSDGQRVKITATLKSPDDYARFLLQLRRASAAQGGPLFASDPKTGSVVPTSSLPDRNSYNQSAGQRPLPALQPQIVKYPISMTVEGTLKDSIIVPPEPGAAPVGAPGGTGGAAPAASPSPTPAR